MFISFCCHVMSVIDDDRPCSASNRTEYTLYILYVLCLPQDGHRQLQPHDYIFSALCHRCFCQVRCTVSYSSGRHSGYVVAVSQAVLPATSVSAVQCFSLSFC